MTRDDVLAAGSRLAGIVRVTPCAHSETLSAMTGARVFLKLESRTAASCGSPSSSATARALLRT